MSLGTESRHCLTAFNVLILGLETTDENEYRELMPPTAIQNHRDRFKVWAGNLGAFQEGRASLDFRLRESSLMRTTILKLLNQLKQTIARSTEVVQGRRLPLEKQFADQIWEDSDSSDDSSVESSVDDKNPATHRTELGQNMSEIVRILSGLFKLSFMIRNPAIRSTTQSTLRALLYKEMVHVDKTTTVDLLASYAEFDRGHVQESFRQMRRSVQQERDSSSTADRSDNPAPGDAVHNSFLIERWSRSLTNRRRYFGYWKKHAKKLAYQGEKPATDEQLLLDIKQKDALSAILNTAPVQKAMNRLAVAPSIAGRTIMSGTEATTYDKKLDDEIDTQSTISHASTAFSYNIDGSVADLPRPPSLKPGQSEFKCPHCWAVCPARHARGKSWIQHILQDLQPYMCTYPECPEPDAMYTSRLAWANHEAQIHRKRWRCFEYAGLFQTKEALTHHLETAHPNFGAAQIQAMSDLGHVSVQDDRTTCPFCLSEGPFQRDLASHMASHMENLACFSVIRSAGTEDDESSSSKSHSGGAQGDRSVDSLRSVVLDFPEENDDNIPVDRPVSPQRSVTPDLAEENDVGKSVADEEVGPKTLTGHVGYVWSVAFSPDGTRLVSGSGDKAIKIWDILSGECIQTLVGHSDGIMSVAFSKDGGTLASGSDDQTIKIWDAVTGECKKTMKDHIGLVQSVTFSPDGRNLASGSSAIFSPDDRNLASSSSAIKLWNMATGESIRTLTGHTSTVSSVVFSPDGSRLISGSYDKAIKIWDVETGKCERTLNGHIDDVFSISLSADGKHLVSGSGDRTIKIWDMVTYECIRSLEGHKDLVWSVAYSPDGSRIVSGLTDDTVKIWDAGTGQCISTLTGHQSDVLSVAFSPDGSKVVSGSWDKTVKIWDLDSVQRTSTDKYGNM
ncbi:hypothetical protein QBC40DRAFT_272760 [Triangularia verruculosa]|uniref:Intraflagellar transport protein 122 homolog n=1 Tax=Triangularia verruculosa TaxID=2587418 RepID=A0AAN6XS11_9PEZI|nr:hypothetical protein QBC40DRAFT_272760 [Triangularia verruculosa]